MMKQNNFIQYNQKDSKIVLTLSFRVNEAENTHFIPKHEISFHSFSEILLDALEQRMKHCQDIRTTEILPAKDKVFTSHMVFSNEVGKHFSIPAYQAMEEASTNLKSFGFTGEGNMRAFLRQLTPLQAQQCLKALATMQTNVRETLLRECVDAVAEAALCNKGTE